MIRFERVTYTYPFQTCPAVSDISFSVRPGELVLCTGASGCGKSTLMRLANGLCPHYFQGTLEGRVLIGGEPTDARPINAIAREVGTLFQDPEQQFFALNVEDELAFAHEWQGVSPEAIAVKIDEAARAFRLGPILSSSIHELSEGQKQKVGLASILSQGPRALILDEPSASYRGSGLQARRTQSAGHGDPCGGSSAVLAGRHSGSRACHAGRPDCGAGRL